jgi:hypothetical protein
VTFTFVAVVWRYGTVKATLIGGGVAGTIDPSEVVELARKQQARMRARLS